MMAGLSSLDFDAYLQQLEKEGTYGDEAVLRAFAALYHRYVGVVSSTSALPVYHGVVTDQALHLGNLPRFTLRPRC